jgi:L-threonylcarbamoyladenylate synthase
MNNWKTIIGKDINYAAQLLMAGELVAMPSETVYGLAGNALNPFVLEKIYKAKERPFTNPLIMHLATPAEIDYYAQDIPSTARLLIEAFMPGPLTVLLPKKSIVPDMVSAGSPYAAFRVPANPTTTQLLSMLPFPLAAPSANRFKAVSPTTTAHVFSQLHNRIPYILDGGTATEGLESTIVGFEGDTVVVHRLGAVTLEQLMEVWPKVVHRQHAIAEATTALAPGTMARHYSPATPLVVTTDVPQTITHLKPRSIGLILLKPAVHHGVCHTRALTQDGDLKKAGQNLYSVLHDIDKLKLDYIVVEKLPDMHLGKTINDRLSRAMVK